MRAKPLGSIVKEEVEAVSFERRIDATLPADYRTFLLETNGAELLDQSFFVRELDQEIKIQVLFGLDNSVSRGLTLGHWLDEFNDELGPDTLLIGKDRGGNFILYTLTGEDQGIYYWDTRNFFPQSSDGGGNTYFLADSFTEFCDSLRDYTPA